MGRRQPGQRDPEGRARHVVKADLVAEVHRGRVATVLAADAELERLPAARPLAQAHRTSSPTPAWSRVSNGLAGISFFSRYGVMIRPSTSSRENPNVICVRSLVPKEKN